MERRVVCFGTDFYLLCVRFLLNLFLVPEEEGYMNLGTSVDLQRTTRHYIPGGGTLQEANCYVLYGLFNNALSIYRL
jgi:hypothetical protein